MLDQRWKQLAALVVVAIVILVSTAIALQHERSSPGVTAASVEQTQTSGDGSIFDGPDTITQWITAIASIAATGISIWAVLLLKDTLRATREAIREAERATEAAEETIAVTRDTAERQLRAYVSQRKVVGNDVRETGTERLLGRSFSVEWKNFGATPARRARSQISWGNAPSELPENFGYPLIEGPWRSETSHIGPGGSILSSIQLGIDDLERAIRGETNLIIWGWIEYNDVFKDTPRRRTEFSMHVEVNGTRDKMSIDLVAVGPHNGADEDCYRQPQT